MESIDLKEHILQVYRHNWRYFLGVSLALVFLVISLYGLNLVLPGTLIMGFCFLVIPFYTCCLIHQNGRLLQGGDYDFQQFYRGYRLALYPGLHGSYRVIRSFLIALSISLGSFIAIFSVASLFMDVVDPHFIALLQASRDNQNEYYQNLATYLSDPPTYFQRVHSVMMTISLGMGLLAFLHCTLHSTSLFYLQTTLGCNKRDALSVYRQVFPSLRRDYYRFFAKTCWMFYLLFPLGFGLGLFGGLILSSEFAVLSFASLSMALLFSSPILPLFILGQEGFFHLHVALYKQASRPILEACIRAINLNTQLSDEQKQVVKSFYLRLLDEIEEMEKKEILTGTTQTVTKEREE